MKYFVIGSNLFTIPCDWFFAVLPYDNILKTNNQTIANHSFISMLLKNASLLIIDDDPDTLLTARSVLEEELKQWRVETNADVIPLLLADNDFDIVLLDVNLSAISHPRKHDLFWLERIKKVKPTTEVIMLASYRDIALAVRARKKGATGFLIKPLDEDKFIAMIMEVVKKKEEINNDLMEEQEIESPKELSELPKPGELKLSEVERNTILKVIEKHNGNITRAAKELGLTRSALYRRLNKYDS